MMALSCTHDAFLCQGGRDVDRFGDQRTSHSTADTRATLVPTRGGCARRWGHRRFRVSSVGAMEASAVAAARPRSRSRQRLAPRFCNEHTRARRPTARSSPYDPSTAAAVGTYDVSNSGRITRALFANVSDSMSVILHDDPDVAAQQDQKSREPINGEADQPSANQRRDLGLVDLQRLRLRGLGQTRAAIEHGAVGRKGKPARRMPGGRVGDGPAARRGERGYFRATAIHESVRSRARPMRWTHNAGAHEEGGGLPRPSAFVVSQLARERGKQAAETTISPGPPGAAADPGESCWAVRAADRTSASPP